MAGQTQLDGRSTANGAPGPPPLLTVEDVTVRFGGVVANNRISFTAGEGAITALLGPNGAGKSTLFDVVTGARRPATGTVIFDGVDITRDPPHRRAQLGIGRTFQNLSVARELTVFENVLLGAARFRNYGPVAAMLSLPKVRRNDRFVRDVVCEAIDVVSLGDVANLPAGDLPFGALHRVELARALALAPRFLMLDEPSAGMDPAESLQLGQALLDIRRRWGTSILVVEHDLEFVRLVAQQATVLDFGQVIASGSIDEVFANADVRRAYLGTVEHA